MLTAIASLEGRGRLVRMTRIAIDGGASTIVPQRRRCNGSAKPDDGRHSSRIRAVISEIVSSRRVTFAAGCCTLSVALLGWTTSKAMRPPRLRHGPSVLRLPMPSIEQRLANTSTDELIENALDHDPFSPNRQRSAPPTPPVAARELAAPEVLHLIGTVIDSSGGSFVLCQLGAGSARVLRVGQEVGVYQLHSISQGTAIFVAGDGQRLELRVSKGGS